MSFSLKWSEVAQSCPTLCDPMDCSLQGSSIHGIFQARVPEWGAISFSRWSSQPRGQTLVSQIAGKCFTVWATKEAVIWLSTVLIVALMLTNSLVILTGWFLLIDFQRGALGSYNKLDRDFPGSPVVKTLHFHSRGRGFYAWRGN